MKSISIYTVATIILVANCLAQADNPIIVRHLDNIGTLSSNDFQPVSSQQTAPMHNTAINLNPGTGISSNTLALEAFNRAAQNWQNYLGDNVVLNINIDMSSLGTGILGSASSTAYYTGYDNIRNMMTVADSGSAAEAATLSYLPTGAQYSAYVPTGFDLNADMTATRANLLALGVSQNQLGGLGTSDASITFSTNFTWDYDNSNGVTSGAFCFESVATHEIGHALGFTSQVDYVDYLLNQGSTTNLLNPRPLDLFRFSSDNVPTTSGEFTNNTRDLVPGGTDYFSYLTDDILMSTGAYNGDGRQASHWKDSLGIGIMDPTLAPGEISTIGYNDLIAMDLIGWQIIPEPATITLFALTALFIRKKK